jgi:hypothetical protein
MDGNRSYLARQFGQTSAPTACWDQARLAFAGRGAAVCNLVGSMLGRGGSGGFDAPANAFVFPDRCGDAWRNTGGVGAIGVLLSMVFQEPMGWFYRLPLQQL